MCIHRLTGRLMFIAERAKDRGCTLPQIDVDLDGELMRRKVIWDIFSLSITVIKLNDVCLSNKMMYFFYTILLLLLITQTREGSTFQYVYYTQKREQYYR